MSRHEEKGTIVIGSGRDSPAYTYNPSDPSSTAKEAPSKSDSGSKKDSKVNKNVNKKDKKYNREGQHKLSSQFEYLADKYYGGDQVAFAKTSQGQLLANYLTGVSQTKGGFKGSLDEETQKKLAQLLPNFLEEERLKKMDVDDFRVENLPIKNLRKPETGLTSDQYRQFNEYLYSRRPDLFIEARPFSSGDLLPKLVSTAISPLGTMTKGIINQGLELLGKDPLKEKEPFKGIAEGNEYTEGLFNKTISPLDTRVLDVLPSLPVDQGGVNEAAQSLINVQIPTVEDEEEDEFDISQFDQDSFIPGFGFPFVDPSLFNLDGTGITGLEV